ncbi:hypothetical protein PCE1_002688 [Barthelona sp. PCE]
MGSFCSRTQEPEVFTQEMSISQYLEQMADSCSKELFTEAYSYLTVFFSTEMDSERYKGVEVLKKVVYGQIDGSKLILDQPLPQNGLLAAVYVALLAENIKTLVIIDQSLPKTETEMIFQALKKYNNLEGLVFDDCDIFDDVIASSLIEFIDHVNRVVSFAERQKFVESYSTSTPPSNSQIVEQNPMLSTWSSSVTLTPDEPQEKKIVCSLKELQILSHCMSNRAMTGLYYAVSEMPVEVLHIQDNLKLNSPEYLNEKEHYCDSNLGSSLYTANVTLLNSWIRFITNQGSVIREITFPEVLTEQMWETLRITFNNILSKSYVLNRLVMCIATEASHLCYHLVQYFKSHLNISVHIATYDLSYIGFETHRSVYTNFSDSLTDSSAIDSDFTTNSRIGSDSIQMALNTVEEFPDEIMELPVSETTNTSVNNSRSTTPHIVGNRTPQRILLDNLKVHVDEYTTPPHSPLVDHPPPSLM